MAERRPADQGHATGAQQAVEKAETPAPGLGSKRRRRPSVRIRYIGEQPTAKAHEPYHRRTKQRKSSSSGQHPTPGSSTGGLRRAPAKTRPLMDLVPDDSYDAVEAPVVAEDRGVHSGESLEALTGTGCAPKEGRAKRTGASASRRVRTNWMSKFDGGLDTAKLESSGDDTGNEDYGEYDNQLQEEPESPFREHSPFEETEARVWMSESREVGPAAAAEMVDVTMDGRNWNNVGCRSTEGGGVRAWLDELGLSRYGPVFEIHEVDEEVLPLLTLDDLKDMGINAVGSRRKMYYAIQKLNKNLPQDF